MGYAHALLTDVGQIRERNEDLAWADPERGLFLLADGMGGHPDGNVASQIAIDTARFYLTTQTAEMRPRNRGQRLAAAIRAANLAIMEAAGKSEASAGMGTTMVCAWLSRRSIHVAHVGDSRLYRVRAGQAVQLTRDHTVAHELISRGVLDPRSPEAHQLGHILTQAVGLEEQVAPDVLQLQTEPGDVFLLCSDGLTDMVLDRNIGEIVERAAGDLVAAADALVGAALNAGGVDNITVVLTQTKPAMS